MAFDRIILISSVLHSRLYMCHKTLLFTLQDNHIRYGNGSIGIMYNVIQEATQVFYH